MVCAVGRHHQRAMSEKCVGIRSGVGLVWCGVSINNTGIAMQGKGQRERGWGRGTKKPRASLLAYLNKRGPWCLIVGGFTKGANKRKGSFLCS